jgi:threonine dehydrogenase-like Zn-dependent dehydrogenase
MGELRNRVVQVRRFGGPDGLEVVDAPLPTAGRGEVRVRVLASGLEYTDVTIRRHLYPQTAARRPPFVLGYDVVGEIDQLGDGVSGFRLGDPVLPRRKPRLTSVQATPARSTSKSLTPFLLITIQSRQAANSGSRRSRTISGLAHKADQNRFHLCSLIQ